MLHVIRKKETKEMVACWAYNPESDSVASLTPAEDEEYVLLRNMTHDTAMAIAKSKALEKDPSATRPGKIFMHDNRVEAEAPEPTPTLASRIRERRKKEGRNLDAPVSLDELEAVEGPSTWEAAIEEKRNREGRSA